MLELGVNIDHIASVRQARYRGSEVRRGDQARHAEPDPARAAHEAEMGGADGITVHLREDRRHIHDRDVERLRELVRTRLNLEMASTDEMVAFARGVKPDTAMLVPEGRDEVTTEGGLDVAGQLARMKDVVASLREGGMLVSAFVDADAQQVESAGEAGFDVCEIHTGPYARAFLDCAGDTRREALRTEIERVADAVRRVRALGMRSNAGHGLNHHNVAHIAAIPGVCELHIGHAIVSRAVFIGLRESVREMKLAMRRGVEEGAFPPTR